MKYLIQYVKYPILYHTYLIFTILQSTPFFCFFKPTCIFRLLFLRDSSSFFELVIFPRFRLNPYTRMCVSSIGSSSTFCKNVKSHRKSQVESLFFWFSLIVVFFVFVFNLSLVTFPSPPGPHGGGGGDPRRCGRPRPLGGRPRAPVFPFLVKVAVDHEAARGTSQEHPVIYRGHTIDEFKSHPRQICAIGNTMIQ